MQEEIERKALLTEEEYTRLYQRLSSMAVPTVYRQVNHYYDTEQLFLSTLPATLRVREKNGGLMLEYKHSQHRIGDVRFAVEDTRRIASVPSKISGASLTGVDAQLVFQHLGTLITDRADFTVGDSLISLDRSEYLGTIDYEIEVETPTATLPKEIAALGVRFSEKVDGKYHRFLALYREKNRR